MNSYAKCNHSQVTCLNQREIIRKYRCATCHGVMMCACDEEYGRRFLSHQLFYGTELRTRTEVPVTHGFQPRVCKECRGEPADSAPMAEMHGATSKIRRYYWREIHMATTRACADWDRANPNTSAEDRMIAHRRLGEEAVEAVKARHAASPKYVISEPSQEQVLAASGIQVEHIEGTYVAAPRKGAVLEGPDGPEPVERFVSRRLEAKGWSAMPLESVPFHALFGDMTWLLIQDPTDSEVNLVAFGNRDDFERGDEPKLIRCSLPSDFGCAGYAERRRRAVDRHFRLVPPEREALLWAFDYWREPSWSLRQYLWAHREEDVTRARRLIEVLPPETVVKVLRYLVADYWRHYLGWPDLLVWRGEEFQMVEVKSSSDKLSADQKRWVTDNIEHLKLPFRLAKVTRPRSRVGGDPKRR